MKTYTTESEKTELGADIRKLINIYINEIKDKENVSTNYIQKFLASKDEFKKYFEIEDGEIVGWDGEIMEEYDYTKMISDIKTSYKNFLINKTKSHYDKKSDLELYHMFGDKYGMSENISYDEVIYFTDCEILFIGWLYYLNDNFNSEKYINK